MQASSSSKNVGASFSGSQTPQVLAPDAQGAAAVHTPDQHPDTSDDYNKTVWGGFMPLLNVVLYPDSCPSSVEPQVRTVPDLNPGAVDVPREENCPQVG